MLFSSEKFYGGGGGGVGGGGGGGDIAIIESSSWSRSLRDLRKTLDLYPSLTISIF